MGKALQSKALVSQPVETVVDWAIRRLEFNFPSQVVVTLGVRGSDGNFLPEPTHYVTFADNPSHPDDAEKEIGAEACALFLTQDDLFALIEDRWARDAAAAEVAAQERLARAQAEAKANQEAADRAQAEADRLKALAAAG